MRNARRHSACSSRLLRRRQPARAEVLRVVGEVLVLVVVVARAAPRCGSAAARRSPRMLAVSSAPSMNSSAITRSSYLRGELVGLARVVFDARAPWSGRCVEPSRAGFTMSGRPSSRASACPSPSLAVSIAIARRRQPFAMPDAAWCATCPSRAPRPSRRCRCTGCRASRARPARCRPRRSGRAAR